ncbi:CMGC kinase, CK2 family [Toxoplasma gondii]|uniref:non-specific serine/threonine protein kinase n=1 Tax=Toxoplasma gondii TaxID=5811 RepID=A0A7J6KCZ2_TOXGO|nr:CMGC kinase, CK2 family [Toxoplasma gondii]
MAAFEGGAPSPAHPHGAGAKSLKSIVSLPCFDEWHGLLFIEDRKERYFRNANTTVFPLGHILLIKTLSFAWHRVTMAAQQKIGDYEIERVVGSGSFGKVSSSRTKMATDYEVDQYNRMTPEEVEEAKNEVQGRPREAHKRPKTAGKPFSETTLRTWLLQLTLSLHFMHKHKILHRDLKPANVFLDQDNYIRVGDLGLSKILEFTLQQAKTQCGTPAFMAPELCQVLSLRSGKRRPVSAPTKINGASGCRPIVCTPNTTHTKGSIPRLRKDSLIYFQTVNV